MAIGPGPVGDRAILMGHRTSAALQGAGAAPRAAEHGEHTEDVLLDLGVGWDELATIESRGAIL